MIKLVEDKQARNNFLSNVTVRNNLLSNVTLFLHAVLFLCNLIPITLFELTSKKF